MFELLTKIRNKYKNMSVVARATLWSAFCGTIQKGISFLTTPIFTRLLSTEEYGLYTAYISWFQIISMICTFNLTYAVFNKGMSKYGEDRDGYMSSMMGTTTLITLGCFVVYLIFMKPINKFTELGPLITTLMFVELIFYPAISFWTLRERYDFKYVPVVVVTLLMAFSNAGFGVLAVKLATNKGLARVLSVIAVNLVFSIVLYIIIFFRGKKFFNIEYAKFAILFNVPLIPHYLSSYILDQSDRVMIQKISGMQYVGIYGVAYSLGMVMKIFTTSVSQSLTPWEYRKLEKGEFKNIDQQTTKILFMTAVFLILFMFIAPEGMLIVGGQKYYEAIYIVPSITATVFFMLAYNVFSNVEFYFDANKFTMVLSSIGAILNIILNYIFIHLYGYVAAGYTTLVCYIVFTIGHFIYAQRVAKKMVGQAVFSSHKIFILSVAMTLASVVTTILYSYSAIRYTLLVIGIILVIVFRKRLISIIKGIRKGN